MYTILRVLSFPFFQVLQLLLHSQYCVYLKHPNKHNQQCNVKAILKKKIPIHAKLRVT